MEVCSHNNFDFKFIKVIINNENVQNDQSRINQRLISSTTKTSDQLQNAVEEDAKN